MSPGAAWTLEREPAFDGYTVEWAGPGRMILSHRNRLYRTAGPGAAVEPLGRVEAPLLQSALAYLRAAQRLLRFSFYNVVELPGDEVFLTFARSAALLRGGAAVPVSGLLRPTRVLRNAVAVDSRGDLYFGEYLPNDARGPVHVYRLRAGSGAVEVAHRFEAGEIRHVHGIYRDAYDGGLWCTTGDLPSECRILRSFDGFRSVELMGGGDETWRCVSLVFTRDAVYYGTDAEFRTNHLYRLDRATGRRDVLGDVEGPVYYSTNSGEDLFFGVTAELCPSQTEPSGVVWYVGPDEVPRRIASFPKGRLSVRFFLPGTINFPGGPGIAGEVYFHGVALKGGDARVHRLRRVSAPSGSR
jgi:hypothetical protein